MQPSGLVLHCKGFADPRRSQWAGPIKVRIQSCFARLQGEMVSADRDSKGDTISPAGGAILGPIVIDT